MPKLPWGLLAVTSGQDRVPNTTSLSTEVQDRPFRLGPEAAVVWQEGRGHFWLTFPWRMQPTYTRRVSRYLLPLTCCLTLARSGFSPTPA